LLETGRALRGGTLSTGPDTRLFEIALGARIGQRHVRAVGSGRMALLLVLEALDIPPRSTILLASYNASCVPNVLQAAGYRLHFVDIREDTLHLDADALPETPPDGTSALIVTHLEGSPATMKPLQAYADRHGLKLIEDAAHALGARLEGRPAGALADGAIFSLGRGKHLNTMGGGLAVVRREDAPRLDPLVDALRPPHGSSLLQSSVMEGLVETGTTPALFGALAMPWMRVARRLGRDPMTALFEDDKSRLAAVPDEMRVGFANVQARFGVIGLDAFDGQLARRRSHAKRLVEALSDLVPLQKPVEGAISAWLEVTALVDDRQRVQGALLRRGIDTQRTWMDACDGLEAFREAGGDPCPVARSVAARALYLPTYAALDDAQVDAVIEAVREELTP
jgi:dTDP-4-amino-4,6-dideoxygalactose transaminase